MSLLNTLLGLQPIRPADPMSALGQLHAIAYPQRVKRGRQAMLKVGHRMAQIMELLADGLRHSTRYLAKKLGVSLDTLYHSLRCMRRAGMVRKAGQLKRGRNYIALWVKA